MATYAAGAKPSAKGAVEADKLLLAQRTGRTQPRAVGEDSKRERRSDEQARRDHRDEVGWVSQLDGNRG